ncbi:MAG TPA: orotidine-5'-phosphate decarboxylase [Ktedonobacteraceae bacterium]|nr:orotidine-5'-phosphate decarboxylase [Ktedonobacteraceae bacterium]
MNFTEKLLAASRRNNSLLCVGLDPEPGRLPAVLQDDPVEAGIVSFCLAIIEATAPYVCAYKPNLAFFEALGPRGLQALQEIVREIPEHIPVIADAKRGDIGSTSRHYAAAIFDVYGCDAATVNPYLGYDSVAPFLAYRDRGILLLCRTSNPGARDFQDLRVQDEHGQVRPLYEVVAQRVQSWNEAGNCGLVAGATYAQELRTLRAMCPDLPILIPGIGAQGGDLQAAVSAGVDARGERAIIAASRSIIYAASDHRYAAAAQEQARALRDRINEVRLKGAV